MDGPICSVPRCGRPTHGHGLCKSHLRHGPDAAVRSYDRKPGAVLYAGIRVLKQTARALRRAERASKLTSSALVARILDAWALGSIWAPAARAGVGAAGIVVLVAAGGLLRCAHDPRRDVETTLTKPMPAKPLEGQVLSPCEKPLVEMVGACWTAVRDETGKQLRGCRASKVLYEDSKGYCWTATYPPPAPQRPNTVHRLAPDAPQP